MRKGIIPPSIILAGCIFGVPNAWAQPTARELGRPNGADIIVSNRRPPDAPSSSAVARHGITRDDFDRIKAISTIQTAVPFRARTHEARYGDRVTDARVLGTTAEFGDMDRLVLARGRFLTTRDVENLNNVAVLSADVASQLFDDEDPLGKNVRIQDDYFIIVGVTEPRSGPARAGEVPTDREIYIPVTTMRSRFGDLVMTREKGTFELEAYELSEIRIAIKDGDDISSAAQEISRILGTTHEARDYSIDIPAR